jgi:hypothetical protein
LNEARKISHWIEYWNGLTLWGSCFSPHQSETRACRLQTALRLHHPMMRLGNAPLGDWQPHETPLFS